MSDVSVLHVWWDTGRVLTVRAAATASSLGRFYTAVPRHRPYSVWSKPSSYFSLKFTKLRSGSNAIPSYLFTDDLHIIRGRRSKRQKNDPKEHRYERKASGPWCRGLVSPWSGPTVRVSQSSPRKGGLLHF